MCYKIFNLQRKSCFSGTIMTNRQQCKSIAWNLFLLTAGGILFSFGIKSVLIHHSFITGGLYGTCLFIFYNFQILNPGVLFLIGNIPIMIIGYVFVSRKFFLYSIWAVFVITLSSELITYDLHIVNQLYAAIAGGVLTGAGSGIILRSVGSGGGLDVLAIVLYQKYNIGIGKFFIVYNLCLFSIALAIYEIDLVIASFILTFISSITLEYVLALFNQRKVVYIISDLGQDISAMISTDLKQGATVIDAKGAYTGKAKQLLMTITNNLQVKRLEEKVFTIDPDALFIVENTFNVIGSGFGKRKIY